MDAFPPRSRNILFSSFLPFKMNDWRFFNVSQNQFFLMFGFNHSPAGAVAAKKRRKKYLYLLIEIIRNKPREKKSS